MSYRDLPRVDLVDAAVGGEDGGLVVGARHGGAGAGLRGVVDEGDDAEHPLDEGAHRAPRLVVVCARRAQVILG